MVVSGSPIASEVGTAILRQGGNAVDAAVGVGFALAVVHPAAGNIGGGGFLVLRLADGEVAALDFRETAPGAATRSMYLDSAGNVTDKGVTGHLAPGVPGSVAGLTEAHRRFGMLPLGQVLAPAIALARDGFVLDEYRSNSIATAANRLGRFGASRAQFLVDSMPPPQGSRLVQADLARTLQAIADSGAQVFYQGYIADLIVAEMARGGGLISKEDLKAYRTIWREPIEFAYRGHTVYSMAPASSGGITLAMILNMLETYESLPSYGTVEQVHQLAEVMRRAFVDRNHYLGDPAFVDMPIARLVSDAYARERQQTIEADHATRSEQVEPGVPDGDHTTHYSVVDARGNAVAVTTTINSGYGSAVTVTGAGFLLNNEMDDFTSAPGRPNMYGLIQGEANAIAPGKRMLSAMTPTIVLDPDGDLLLVLGSPGGPTIITTVAQVISNVVDYGMSLADAVAAPRIHHQALPDWINYEQNGLHHSTVERLRRMGHVVEERTGHSGDVAAIQRDGNHLVGVADPRRGGGVSGY
jgi:gamma-glutamyltranspeptidase/glutathione hydrolase